MTTAAEHHRVADLLEAAAGDLEPLVAGLESFHRPDVWSGRRADRFGRDLADRRRQLRMTSEELRSQAGEVRSRARLLELFSPGDP